MVSEVGALGKHIALIGFMGAGKTTIGKKVARLTERPFFDLDEEIERRHGPIPELFEERGEPEFRVVEESIAAELLATGRPAVIALGGGAVLSEQTCGNLRDRALTLWVEVDVGHAWSRVRASDRPLARDEQEFRRLFAEREDAYSRASDGIASDVEDVLLEALGIYVESGILGRLEEQTGVKGQSVALIADERVLKLHQPRLAERLVSTHTVPPGEAAKTLEVAGRLWHELEIDRAGTIVALGGGTTTDIAGFVAATFLRGIRWLAVPTTLVGQVDAAIGGKTGADLAAAKNLVGAFHYPLGVAIDPNVLRTLPEAEQHNGIAEVVKTGLLAGKDLRGGDERTVRACASFKASVCLSDPYEQTGRRSVLNFGHTFAHALETASDYELPHGEAVALGLLAALRLSGIETAIVDEVLRPEPARVDPERAWAAMRRDKKALDGRIRLVLLEAPGKPVFPVELPDATVRRELERLIAK